MDSELATMIKTKNKKKFLLHRFKL